MLAAAGAGARLVDLGGRHAGARFRRRPRALHAGRQRAGLGRPLAAAGRRASASIRRHARAADAARLQPARRPAQVRPGHRLRRLDARRSRRHPTKEDLDRVSTELPVWVVHASRHMAVGNSMALDQAGIAAATPDPAGGQARNRPSRRAPASRPGCCEEAAWAHVRLTLLPPVPEHHHPDLIATDGRVLRPPRHHHRAWTGRRDVGGMKMLHAAPPTDGSLPDRCACPIRCTSSPSRAARRRRALPARLRRPASASAGCKIVLDGSPQGKTRLADRAVPGSAARGARVLRGASRCSRTTTSYRMVADCFARGVQVLAHANGDAAAEQMIEAVARAGAAARARRANRSPAGDGPRPDRARRPAGPDAGARHHSVVLRHALLLLGRLARRLGARAASGPTASARRARRSGGGCGSACTTTRPSSRPNILFSDLERGDPPVAQRRGDRPRAAPDAGRGPAGRHPRRRLPVLRGGARRDRSRSASSPTWLCCRTTRFSVAPEAIKEIAVLATLKEGVPIYVLERARLPEALADGATSATAPSARRTRPTASVGRSLGYAHCRHQLGSRDARDRRARELATVRLDECRSVGLADADVSPLRRCCQVSERSEPMAASESTPKGRHARPDREGRRASESEGVRGAQLDGHVRGLPGAGPQEPRRHPQRLPARLRHDPVVRAGRVHRQQEAADPLQLLQGRAARRARRHLRPRHPAHAPGQRAARARPSATAPSGA